LRSPGFTTWDDQVEDQSQTNSCCANAVCGAYEYMGKRDTMEKGRWDWTVAASLG